MTIERGKRFKGYVKPKTVTSITVTQTRKNPSDTCEVEFPRHRDIKLNFVSVGDVIDVSLGYGIHGQAALRAVFSGEIVEVSPNLPLKIRAVSKSYGASKNGYKQVYKNATWKDIIEDAIIKAGCTVVWGEYPISGDPPESFTVDGQTPAQVLNGIADVTGCVWYALPGTDEIYFGHPFEEPAGEGKVYLFEYGKNIVDCNVEYEETSKLKKVVVTLTDNNFKVGQVTGEYVHPDYEDGDAVKYIEQGDGSPTKDKADKLAYDIFLKEAVSGFSGNFTAVGNPHMKQGSKAQLLIPDLNSSPLHFVAEQVVHKFGDAYLIDVEVAGGYEG